MPDGKSMLFGSPNELIFMNVANGVIRSRFQFPASSQILPSPDGRLLAFERGQAGTGHKFSILETLTGKELTSLPSVSSSVAPNLFWADNRSLIFVADHRIEIWDVLTGKIRYRASAEFENGSVKEEARIVHATLLPDRRHVLTAQSDQSGLLWDLAPGEHPTPNSAGAVARSVADKWWDDLASEKPLEASSLDRAPCFRLLRLRYSTDAPGSKIGRHGRANARKAPSQHFRPRFLPVGAHLPRRHTPKLAGGF